MTAPAVVIVGAGGHGLVVADALVASGRTVLGFVDPIVTGRVGAWPVLGDDGILDSAAGYELANGLGGNGVPKTQGRRRQIQERLEAKGFRFAGVRHPSAIVSPNAQVAADAQIMARAVIQVGGVVGRGVIINTAVVVEHGARVGDFTHCATGAILCGDVRVGSDAHVGAGAIVRQGVTLEDGVLVGAAALVLTPGQKGAPLLGVPAQRRRLP